MYELQPKGLNIKDNDRNVPDGFLQESINLQWKDGSYKPIPSLLDSGITNTLTSNKIILHKVSDEDVVNVLAIFPGSGLKWMGYIENGVYNAIAPTTVSGFPIVTDFDSLSFTILNGIIYFMSVTQEFYYKVQYNEVDNTYEVKNMYAWKDLIPYYPSTLLYAGSMPKGTSTNANIAQCGIILIRFTLVLKTGEEVLHSPIYGCYMFSINTGTVGIKKGDALKNIHTIINTNLEFSNMTLFNEEISAINVYASIPNYTSIASEDAIIVNNTQVIFSEDNAKGEVQILAESPFYLIKTIEKPSTSVNDNNILLYAGHIDSTIDYPTYEYSRINIDTIAAGQIMPVDNFSYHKLFGRITSNNGRLIIDNPKTILSIGHIRALSLNKNVSRVGFYINTEDGDLSGVGYLIDTEIDLIGAGPNIEVRGILSYPDSRATYVGGNITSTNPVGLYKLRANKVHNLACAFKFIEVASTSISILVGASTITWSIGPPALFRYEAPDISIPIDSGVEPLFYSSENRIQFSEFGEFSVWPVSNSHRVGEGKIVFVGSNSIDPANTDYISPLLIGTSDGVYTANFDTSGVNIIQSITKTANLPALSDKNILIDQNLIYVSDKGLIVINNGKVINITEEYFPEFGNGNFPDNNTVYPNYTLLTPYPSPDLSGDDFQITDIIDYMKGALFAYDGRRNNVWCSNPTESFSLIYNLKSRQWTMCTTVFDEVIDFGGLIDTANGDVYSRYLVVVDGIVRILSSENLTSKVYTHLLTRPIKMQSPEQYKKIQSLFSRCELYRDDANGYFTFGIWGKQDLNKDKVSIPLAAYVDGTSNSFPGNIRQNIPVGNMKGKYKLITILQGGYVLPSSSIDNYEIIAIAVENNKIR